MTTRGKHGIRGWTARKLCLIAVVPLAGCWNPTDCIDRGRDWTVRGQVLDADGVTPLAGAEVEVFWRFAIDGPGNRTSPVSVTNGEGQFQSHMRFEASCLAGIMGGSEAGHTDSPPWRMRITIRSGGLETVEGIHLERSGADVELREIPGFGVEGTVELRPVVFNETP